MYCLAVDTSSKFLCVAVIKDEKILAQYNKVHERQHSVLLLSKIEKVLRSSGLSLCDMDCFAVDIGPGSFTGLRIGIAAVKGLSLAMNKPIIGICSLDLIAALQPETGKMICPVIDAKRQQVYGAFYKHSKNQIKRDRPFEVVSGVHQRISPSDQFSFPSGHTAAAFVIATLIRHFFPSLLVPVYLWAFLMGVSRIYLGVHYPTDILAGLVIGIFSAFAGIMVFG